MSFDSHYPDPNRSGLIISEPDPDLGTEDLGIGTSIRIWEHEYMSVSLPYEHFCLNQIALQV